ncbi:ribitol 5-phosphate transferase FKRP [Anopheles aquasalis]|uniref:ribitol 5-phosphate transferase FKRP n=1 Tax=Anopheles aquasalis TaxID=42839 RepID=UPI00215A65C0|nr:ribitol 5-phosphate transferase FKRP [Anopheles aquasalis]
MKATKMRMKYGKLFIFFMICFNLIVFYYSWKYFLTSGHYLAESLSPSGGRNHAPVSLLRPEPVPLVSYESSYRIGDPGGATFNRLRLAQPSSDPVDGPGQRFASQRDRVQVTNGYLRRSVTFVFRDFYDFDNDLLQSIGSVTSLIPNVNVMVIAPELPYPPLDIFNPALQPTPAPAGKGSATSQSRQRNHSVPSTNGSWFAENSNVRFFSLGYDVTKSLRDTFPMLHVTTRYVLFMPDSVRLTGRALLSRALREIDTPSGEELLLQQHQHLLLRQNQQHLRQQQQQQQEQDRHQQQQQQQQQLFDLNRKPERRIIAIPFASNQRNAANCVQLQLDLPNWTLEYVTGNDTESCDMFKQKHAILVETELLKEMPDALAAPFPDVFYLQAKLAGVKKVLLNAPLQDGRKLFTSYHTKTKRRNQRKEQFKALYRRLQVKKVIRKNYLYDKSNRGTGPGSIGGTGPLAGGGPGGMAGGRRKYIKSYEHNNQTISLLTEITFYGCEKQTKSCIGQVHNGRPFYRYLGRHTPPCCMEKLKATFRHVVDEFENVGIRYWLDNYALKNAIEQKTLSADAYEIDLSFNADDIQRSVALRKAQIKPYTDEEGFHWLKATDGHYFRVQFSKANTIAINLLPFDLSNGELVRPNGFYGWKARKFSVEFLHPMSTVLFLGKPIMCPNNVIEYLEVKNVK